MRITIEIPKEFEEHWAIDRFQESLERLREDAHCLAWRYERELADMLIEAFRNAEVEEEKTQGDAKPAESETQSLCDTCYFRGKERGDEPCWKCTHGVYLHSKDMYLQDQCKRTPDIKH